MSCNNLPVVNKTLTLLVIKSAFLLQWLAESRLVSLLVHGIGFLNPAETNNRIAPGQDI